MRDPGTSPHAMEDPGPFVATDLNNWPVAKITLLRLPNNLEEIDEFQDVFIDLLTLARDGEEGVPPTKLIPQMDLSVIVFCTAEQVVRALSFITAAQEFLEQIFCTALVVENPDACTIVKQLLTLVPLKSVNAIFENAELAAPWVSTNRAAFLRGDKPVPAPV